MKRILFYLFSVGCLIFVLIANLPFAGGWLFPVCAGYGILETAVLLATRKNSKNQLRFWILLLPILAALGTVAVSLGSLVITYIRTLFSLLTSH